MKHIVGKAFAALTLPLFITGCGTTHKLKFQNFTEEYKQANYSLSHFYFVIHVILE